MVPRKPPKVRGIIFPRNRTIKHEGGTASAESSAATEGGIGNPSEPRQYKRKQGEGDPKLAAAILELAQGYQFL